MGWSFYNSSGQLLTAPASTASADLATEATNVTVTQNDSEAATLYPVFVDGYSSTQGIEADSGLTYNPNTGVLTGTQFTGAVSGNATSSTSTTNITVADTTDTTCFVGLWESVTGSQAPKSDAGITYNAGTGILTATGFAGPITGNVTGNTSGTSGSTTGNAATVTTNANLTGDVTSSGNAATLVLSNLTGEAINVAADSIPFLDADGSATRIESIADLATAMAGANLTASSGQLVAGAAGVGLGLVVALS